MDDTLRNGHCNMNHLQINSMRTFCHSLRTLWNVFLPLKKDQAERNMIYLAFAYDHQNYAHYNTYQNVYLSHLKQIDHSAFNGLKTKGNGGSITGGTFPAIHVNLFTELFNRETKGTAGPFCSGFSTDIDAVHC